eukprot:GHRR01024089.1.p4 GENE.GHRR01024089.1~~GHRR01024089.1.p4  ORF type:complete len:110 (-),score=21.36 GHRR01024089.1:83-412(-)
MQLPHPGVAHHSPAADQLAWAVVHVLAPLQVTLYACALLLHTPNGNRKQPTLLARPIPTCGVDWQLLLSHHLSCLNCHAYQCWHQLQLKSTGAAAPLALAGLWVLRLGP